MADHSATSPVHVLITEDHSDTAKFMKMLLERQGMVVQISGTMAEALELAKREKFDLLIADMRLPDGDGFILNLAVQQIQKMKSISLSGDVVTPDDGKGQPAPFTAYLTKPVDLPKLVQTIREIMSEP